jgi:hypothetical protein
MKNTIFYHYCFFQCHAACCGDSPPATTPTTSAPPPTSSEGKLRCWFQDVNPWSDQLFLTTDPLIFVTGGLMEPAGGGSPVRVDKSEFLDTKVKSCKEEGELNERYPLPKYILQCQSILF